MNYAGSRPVAFLKTWMLCGALCAPFSTHAQGLRRATHSSSPAAIAGLPRRCGSMPSVRLISSGSRSGCRMGSER